MPLLDHVLVADGAEAVGAGAGVEAAPVAALHRVLLHLVRLLVHGAGQVSLEGFLKRRK